jgi:hypothetical protein
MLVAPLNNLDMALGSTFLTSNMLSPLINPGTSSSKTSLMASPTGPSHFTESIAKIISPIAPLAFGLVEELPSPSSQLQKAKEAMISTIDKVNFFEFPIIYFYYSYNLGIKISMKKFY